MIVLGVDPGLNTTGCGLIESSNFGMSHIAHGVIKPRGSDHPLEERLYDLHDQLMQVLADPHLPLAHLAGVETPFVGPRVSAAIPLASARAILLLVLRQAGVPIVHISPTDVKRAMTGSGGGRSDKSQVARMVEGVLGISLAGVKTDCSDALAIAIVASGRK